MNKTSYDRGLEQGRQEGKQEGVQQGRQEGMQQGVQQGVQQGRQEGRQEGLVLARRAAVLELLEATCGPVPADLTERVNATDDSPTLRRWLILAAQAESVDAFRERMGG